MLFNKTTIKKKIKYLDVILKNESLLRKIFNDFTNGVDCDYQLIKRPWNPGGGSTLFVLTLGTEKYFLKVKSTAVFVESKLEAEETFTEIPSLKNEYCFLQKVKGISPNVPQFFEYVEEDGFSFLFIEHLWPFKDRVVDFNSKELLEVYEQIELTVRNLYENDIVHTDIHENNIMFRENIPVLIDFEEAKVLSQQVPFEESLDMCGENAWGNVGHMPEEHGFAGGYTCLNRLKQVFTKLITSRLNDLVKECNFDSSCPFLNALDHGEDERLYQSINLPDYSVEGQRPLIDDRIEVIVRISDKLFRKPFTHLDIGSNLGRFNIEISKNKKVKKTFGVEAFKKYVDLARVLAFLSNSPNVKFINAVCGKDSLFELLGNEKIDLVTIYSIYHHIENKKAFIDDLRRLNPSYLMFEMPVQKECYGGNSWKEEISLISQRMKMPYWYLLTHTHDYKRPVVLVSRRDVSKVLSEIKDSSSSPRARNFLKIAQKPPKVSVVLPTYNHIQFLPRSIQSVLGQTFSDFELIIINDGSTDGTREFLDSLNEPCIRVIHQENKKLPEALNIGFKSAKGELFTWISADNYCAPIFLEALVTALKTYPEVGFAYSAFAEIDTRDQIIGIYRDPDLSYHKLLPNNACIASFMYRRICQDKVGLYNPELEGAEDWDMWLRTLEHFSIVYIPEILYYYRFHDKTMTNQLSQKVRESSENVFLRAFERKGENFNLEEIYPFISSCRDINAAWFNAAFDFGAKLLKSPFVPPAIACQFLEKALSIFPQSFKVGINLAIGYGRIGEWDKLRQVTIELKKINQPSIHKICAIFTEAYSQRNSLLLNKAPVILPDKSSAELFQLEKKHKRVFSLTHAKSAKIQ